MQIAQEIVGRKVRVSNTGEVIQIILRMSYPWEERIYQTVLVTCWQAIVADRWPIGNTVSKYILSSQD